MCCYLFVGMSLMRIGYKTVLPKSPLVSRASHTNTHKHILSHNDSVKFRKRPLTKQLDPLGPSPIKMVIVYGKKVCVRNQSISIVQFGDKEIKRWYLPSGFLGQDSSEIFFSEKCENQWKRMSRNAS